MLPHLVTIFCLVIQIWARPNVDSDAYMHPRLPPPRNLDGSYAANPAENTAQYWIDNAQATIRSKISRPYNQNIAKNVILFLGDGMSIPTITAARAYLGGEELQLAFDKFPYTALSKTYSVNKQVSDSAVTATAYLGGVKGNYGTIGVTGAVQRDDCVAMQNTSNHVFSIAYQAQLAGKKTGIVTTARVTHASPAGVYAHTAERDWECDTDVLDFGLDPLACPDIATQLVYGETGSKLDVIMGGGRQEFLPEDVIDEEGKNGHRSDGKNLIDEWLNQHSHNNAEYIYRKAQLTSVGDSVEQLLGLFSDGHMDYNIDRDTEMDPSLAEMTETAINILNRGENGYFLFVEGARIDMAHHDNRARKAFNETIEFSKAIQTAVDITDELDTLIIVTADHAHTMSYSGYAHRGNNILEFGGSGTDDIVYTTINYANGPGFKHEKNGDRPDFSENDLEDVKLRYPAIAPLDSETHGGDDVGVFALGPWEQLFTGVIEENVIPHLMMYASCIGEGAKACD